jgi:hypothetical protein
LFKVYGWWRNSPMKFKLIEAYRKIYEALGCTEAEALDQAIDSANQDCRELRPPELRVYLMELVLL